MRLRLNSLAFVLATRTAALFGSVAVFRGPKDLKRQETVLLLDSSSEASSFPKNAPSYPRLGRLGV